MLFVRKRAYLVINTVLKNAASVRRFRRTPDERRVARTLRCVYPSRQPVQTGAGGRAEGMCRSFVLSDFFKTDERTENSFFSHTSIRTESS